MSARDPERSAYDDLDRDIDPAFDGDDEIDGSEDDGGAFHDPVLRRALAYATDHAVVPMNETRESIRAFAHEAVAPSLPAATHSASRSVLQRALGLRGGAGVGAHVPWNAVGAMVALGAVMLWQDRQPASDTAREEADSTTAVAEAPLTPDVRATPSTPADIATPAATTPAASAPSSPTTAEPAPAPPPAAAPPPMIGLSPLETPPPVESSADAAARVQLEQKLQRLEAAEARARLAQQSDAGGLPTSPFPSALPKTAIPVEVARAGRAAAVPAGASAPALPSAGAGRVEDASPPNFVALSQWTRLTITPAGGESRRVARSEAGELGALVGSAALAGVGSQPLSGRVDWRVVFERNGEPLATLETAGNQVRWKEGGMAAATGVPPGDALASLRQALKQAQAQAQAEAARPAVPTVPATPAPAQSEASPAASAPVTAPAPAPAFEMPR